MNDYQKMNKAQLLEEIVRLSNELDEAKIKVSAGYDKLNLEHEIVVAARREDAEKVKKAEIVLATFQSREEELLKYFELQKTVMKKDLDGQNEAMVSLFEMTDATINLQILYYNKFKNIFIDVKQKEE